MILFDDIRAGSPAEMVETMDMLHAALLEKTINPFEVVALALIAQFRFQAVERVEHERLNPRFRDLEPEDEAA